MADFVQRLKGNLFLLYRAAVAHPLRLLLDSSELPGKRRFLANYAPEGNLPTSLADREVLLAASRCIHCGLCDAQDLALAAAPRTGYLGASQLPVRLSRAMPDLEQARGVLSRVNEQGLRAGEAVCPTRVPLVTLFRYLERKLAELDAEKQAAAAIQKA
ncbi:MAG TPA: (Fe-S)-binding protein [Myxococcaceae bacterium]|nr:(Fe-S)-binding protein [Myxococcaceae bacterium]